MVSTIRVKELTKSTAVINVHVLLVGGAGYETDVTMFNDGDGWTASIEFKDMPPQESFEAAIDRLALYLKAMSPQIKPKNLKYANPEKVFKPTYR